MHIAWDQILPVIISILVIIAIAILQAYSKPLAAITATMPLTIPLALWVVHAAEGGDKTEVLAFTESLLIGLVATVFFAVALWLAARAGWGLAAMLAAAYGSWAAVLGAHWAIRAWLN
jgi:hypothetical protein